MSPGGESSSAGTRRDVVAGRALVWATALLILIAVVDLLLILTFAAGGRVSAWHLPVGAACTLAVFGFLLSQSRPAGSRREIILSMLVLLLLVPALLAISGQVYDTSWDGQSYHQEGVIQLARGWNLLLDTRTPEQTNHEMELRFWAKGPWLFEAAVYSTFDRIEMAKGLNLLLIVASFLATIAALLPLRTLPAWAAVTGAGILALNPVSVNQCLSFYVDGQLSSLLVIMASLLFRIHLQAAPPVYTALGLALALGVGSKFTGIPIAGIFVSGACVGLVILRRRNELRSTILATLGGFIAGVLILGYNPYVTNTLRQGNPFHPMAGPGAFYHSILLDDQLPADFVGRNRVEKLARSVFSRSVNAIPPATSALKMPFSVDRAEVATLGEFCDTRVSGWGPLFSGACLVAVAILIGALGVCRRAAGMSLLVAAVVLASVVILSEAWWARLSPQLWLIPTIAFILSAGSSHRPLRLGGSILALILALNIGLIGAAYVRKSHQRSATLSRQLLELSRTDTRLVVFFNWFRTNRLRLADHGIVFREVPRPDLLPCAAPESLTGSLAQFCREPVGTRPQSLPGEAE